MVVVNKIRIPDQENENQQEEQTWENPVNPEEASDTRDIEQLQRQKKEAELRKKNLSDEPDENN